MNLGVVFFTNEKTCDLTNLTVPFYITNSQNLNLPITVLSNKFPPNHPRLDGVKYFETNTPYSGAGKHFSDVLKKFLSHSSFDHILFLCDDYLVNAPIKEDIFNSIYQDILVHNISKLHLGTLLHIKSKFKEWNIVEKEKYKLVEIDKNYRHVLSVQPCIWNTKDLLEILDNNPEMSLHDLDNSNIRDIYGKYRVLQEDQQFYIDKEFTPYNQKYFGVYSGITSYHVDERPLNSEYLVLSYIEFIRHGKILEPSVNSKKIIMNILENNNLLDNYKHYI